MPEEVFALIFFITIFSFITALTVIGQRHKLRMRRLELEEGDGASNEQLNDEIEQLHLELRALKRTVQKQQRALEESGMRIDLTPYEREQLKIDQNDKFTF